MNTNWLETLQKGDETQARRALARLISILENASRTNKSIIEGLFKMGKNLPVWGITGPPGAGKSTITDQLIKMLREKQKRVAVLCVDPSSPFTGGAILGDRIRMQSHYQDSGVYIRSLGSRGHQGGLSQSTRDVLMAVQAGPFDVILIETVGVGQTELDILQLAHTVAVVLVPESGDGIQMMKAGLMEIADLFVLNKSDRPGADLLAKELHALMHDQTAGSWSVPVIKTVAMKSEGVHSVLQAFEDHEAHLKNHQMWAVKVKNQLKSQVLQILMEELRESIESVWETQSGQEVLTALLSKKLSPYEAAQQLSGTS